MKKLKKYNEFKGELTNEKLSDYLKGKYRKGLDFTKDFFKAAKNEGTETLKAANILRRILKKQEVKKSEIEFLKAQSRDILKLMPFIAIQGLPGGTIVGLPAMKLLKKATGINLFPTSHLKDYKEYDEIDEDILILLEKLGDE